MKMLRLWLADRMWHHIYWSAVHLFGTDPEWITDLAERRADARIAWRIATGYDEWLRGYTDGMEAGLRRAEGRAERGERIR